MTIDSCTGRKILIIRELYIAPNKRRLHNTGSMSEFVLNSAIYTSPIILLPSHFEDLKNQVNKLHLK